MKSLKARVKGCFGIATSHVLAGLLLFSSALGQATPDVSTPVPIPEPQVWTLIGIGLLALYLARPRKK